MIINGISFIATGNIQTDAANYAKIAGVDESTAQTTLLSSEDYTITLDSQDEDAEIDENYDEYEDAYDEAKTALTNAEATKSDSYFKYNSTGKGEDDYKTSLSKYNNALETYESAKADFESVGGEV